MDENEVINFIDNYIENVKIDYAILLDGAWGSGKTFFIKEKVIKKLNKEYEEEKAKDNKDKNIKVKKPIYISLYGLNSIADIKSQLLLSTIRSEKIKKFIPIINVGTSIIDELIKAKVNVSNTSGKIQDLFNDFYKLDNTIIFFDDLERCSININLVLGYINQLVEHNHLKIVLIADENKMGKLNYEDNKELKYLTVLNEHIDFQQTEKKDIMGNPQTNSATFTIEDIENRSKMLFRENIFYNEIKEKLIGQTISFRPNINNIYDIMATKIISNAEVKDIVMAKKELLISIISQKRHWNLRTLQFIFQTFETLAKTSMEEVNLKEFKNQYLTNLFEYCILKSIQIKNGQKSYNWKENQEFGAIYLGDKKNEYIYNNYVNGFKFVDDYLMYSYIDKSAIRTTINNYIYVKTLEIENPNDPLYKLNKYWLISEQELENIVDEIIDNIIKNKYVLNLYSKIVFDFACIFDMGICEDKINNAIKLLEKNIEEECVQGTFEEERLFTNSKSISQKYKEFMKNIRILVNKKDVKTKHDEIIKILESDNWGSELKEYCKTNVGQFFEEKKYAYLLNIELIINNIKNKNIKQIYEFLYSLQQIYGFSNVNDYFIEDKDILINLRQALSNIDNVDKVKKHAINNIISFLNDVINILNSKNKKDN